MADSYWLAPPDFTEMPDRQQQMPRASALPMPLQIWGYLGV